MTDGVYHCSLHGLVKGPDVEGLVSRISGICENHHRSEWDHIINSREAVFTREKEMNGPVPVIPASEVRVIQRTFDDNTEQWSLLYYGFSVQREDLWAYCRPIVEVEVSNDIEQFLKAMNYQKKFEYHTSGLRFQALPEEGDNPFYISVYTVGIHEENEFLIPEWVVEMVGYAKDTDILQVTKELHNFANRLVPSVNMVKMDLSTQYRMKQDRIKRQRVKDKKKESNQ